MDETRARAFLVAAAKPAEAATWLREFLPDPVDVGADVVTIAFAPGTAEVSVWSRRDEVKESWTIDDAGGREVIGRHMALGTGLGLVPSRSILTQRAVLYADGRYARFDNMPFAVREKLDPGRKEAWRELAKQFAGMGPGEYELVDRPDVGETVLVHPGPYPGTLEVGFFTSDPARVRAFSWDGDERRAALYGLERADPTAPARYADAAVLERYAFAGAALAKHVRR
jgi:hypothetical protein